MKKLMDTYTIYARFFPCIISALPLFVLWFFLSRNVQLRELWAFLSGLKFYGGVGISLVALYFYAQVIRITSKFFEDKYFLGNAGFPTTYLMTYEDTTFSKSYKDEYRKLVKKHLDIDLSNESEELADIGEACKRLNETAKHVILKVGDGQLVKEHNIWYGFVRNLIGGTIFSMVFCLINIAIGILIVKSSILVSTSSVLLIMYASLFISRKRILVQNAEAFAKQLIAEFMSLG
jgi:hypothetical protein